AFVDFRNRKLLIQFQFGDFLTPHDAQGQGQGEYQPGFGVEAFGGMKRQGRPPEHALETAHQVMMADQTEGAAFAEPDSDLIADHARMSTPQDTPPGRVRGPGASGKSGNRPSPKWQVFRAVGKGKGRWLSNGRPETALAEMPKQKPTGSADKGYPTWGS